MGESPGGHAWDGTENRPSGRCWDCLDASSFGWDYLPFIQAQALIFSSLLLKLLCIQIP